MTRVTATEATNKLDDIWALADKEPVIVEHNGVPKYKVISMDRYVAVSGQEYDRLGSARRSPSFGFARQEFPAFDSNALLAVDVTNEFENYQ
jgi:PHD/YefM family antitoxin component YafN of YafNO toxin-antitoxin module